MAETSDTAVLGEEPQPGGNGAGVKVVGVAGLFDDPNVLLETAKRVRDAGWTRWNCHTPYPVHGLSEAMGLKASPIPVICIVSGFVGAGLAMLMQWWMSAVDFPVPIGGKPFFSWPAFIPITFELFVLFAAFATFGSMIAFCRLGRWHSPLRDSGFMEEVASSRYAVVLHAEDPRYEEGAARRLLERGGCSDIRPLVERIEEDDSFL